MSIQFQRRFLLEDEDSTVDEVGTGTAAAGATLEPVRVKRKMEEKEFETGLVVVGRTQLDNQKISEVIEEEGLHAEWNPREGYWFFPEELDLYDGLEKILTHKFEEKDINARFEGVFMEDAPILAGGKIKDNYAVSHFGYKEVPKGHAELKGIIVKDLWESEQETASNLLSLLAHPAFKRSLERLYDEAPLERSNRIKQVYDALYGELKKSETLQENYHRFKKETVTRTKAQQMHEAAKAIEKKLHEVNKILEYTSKLKSELFEEDGVSEVSHHTNKVMEKVTRSIAEAYSKLKNIK